MAAIDCAVIGVGRRGVYPHRSMLTISGWSAARGVENRRRSICAGFGRVLEVVGEHAGVGEAVEDLLHACPPARARRRDRARHGFTGRTESPLAGRCR